MDKHTTLSSSYAVTASYASNAGGAVAWNDLTGKPTGLVSSSTQVTFTGISSKPTGLVSSSAQATTWTVATASFVSNSIKDAYVTMQIGNGTDLILTGSGGTSTTAGYVFLPPGTIVSATLVASPAGTMTVAIWSDTYTNFPPTSGDLIGTIGWTSTNSGSQDTTLSGWTTDRATPGIADVRIASASAVKTAMLVLQIRRG